MRNIAIKAYNVYRESLRASGYGIADFEAMPSIHRKAWEKAIEASLPTAAAEIKPHIWQDVKLLEEKFHKLLEQTT